MSIVTHKNTDVDKLNELIRKRLGYIHKDGIQVINSVEKDGEKTDKKIDIVPGEYISFTRNQRLKNGTEIRNGQQAVVKDINGAILSVQRGDEKFTVDTTEYSDISYGYAMTIHKSQGVTVNDVVLYAGNSTGSEAGYVAFTRHRRNFDAVFNETVFERPDITLPSDYFNKISELNGQEQRALHALKKALNQKATPEELKLIDAEAEKEARMVFEKEYQVSAEIDEIKSQAHSLYLSGNPMKAVEGLDSHVTQLYSVAKRMTEDMKSLRFIGYKDAVAKQPEIIAQTNKIQQLKEQQENMPDEGLNERLNLATRQLKSLYHSDDIRSSAKSRMLSHNGRVKKNLFIKDMMWKAAKETQANFTDYKKQLEEERQESWKNSEELARISLDEKHLRGLGKYTERSNTIVDILWRRDLVERYAKGEMMAEQKFAGVDLERAKDAGYTKLLDIQKKENTYDKPELWRADLIATARNVIEQGEKKEMSHEQLALLEKRTHDAMLHVQSRNRTADNERSYSSEKEIEK